MYPHLYDSGRTVGTNNPGPLRWDHTTREIAPGDTTDHEDPITPGTRDPQTLLFICPPKEPPDKTFGNRELTNSFYLSHFP